jgi:hypothetical protein
MNFFSLLFFNLRIRNINPFKPINIPIARTTVFKKSSGITIEVIPKASENKPI